jgi:LCP family protein required for cell wall assembly
LLRKVSSRGSLRTKRRASPSARRWRKRAQYRRRRFFAAIILAGLFFASGTQAAALLQDDSGETANSAGGAVKSPGVDNASYQGSKTSDKPTSKSSGAPPAPSSDKTDQVLTSQQDTKSGKDARDKDAREAARQAEQKAAKQLDNASDDPLDVLVLGVDQRPAAAAGESTRSDTMMLVRVTPSTGRVKLLSVPRDLYVEIEPGVKDKINAAYAYGGVDQARSVMEDVTGVDIDNYVVVDFEGFEKVIDIIGGVKVDVGHDVFPAKWHMGEGVQRLGGRKALFYARYRGTPRADLDRIDHQQKLLAALRRQAFRWNSVTKLPGIIKATNDNVSTDLGVWQVIPLARALVLNGRDGKMTSSELQGYPTYLDEGAQVLMPEQDANDAILKDFRE